MRKVREMAFLAPELVRRIPAAYWLLLLLSVPFLILHAAKVPLASFFTSCRRRGGVCMCLRQRSDPRCTQESTPELPLPPLPTRAHTDARQFPPLLRYSCAPTVFLRLR